MANLSRYLKEDRILVGMKAQKKGGAIRELASRIADGPEISDVRRFLSGLFQQESQISTGVGKKSRLPNTANLTTWISNTLSPMVPT